MELSQKAPQARPVNEDSIPRHLRCSGCSELPTNCYQTPHGCRLCQQCVASKLLPNHRRRLCPCPEGDCRDEEKILEVLVSQEDCIPDFATRSDVMKLVVHCPNAESGCQSQLTMKKVDSHLASECEYQLVTCDLCSQRVVQFELNRSHRSLESADCCPQLRAPCPLCGDSSAMFDRPEFVEHLKSCPERPSECKYRVSVGCQATLRMSLLDEHYSSGADGHLELMVQQSERMMEHKDAELRDLKQGMQDLLVREEMKDAELRDVKQGMQDLLVREEMKDAELRDLRQGMQDLLVREEMKDAELRVVKQHQEEFLAELERMQKKLAEQEEQYETKNRRNLKLMEMQRPLNALQNCANRELSSVDESPLANRVLGRRRSIIPEAAVGAKQLNVRTGGIPEGSHRTGRRASVF